VLSRVLDSVGRIASIEYSKAGTTLIGYNYGYDLAGNKMYEREPDGCGKEPGIYL